jgi:hypothetical protein
MSSAPGSLVVFGGRVQLLQHGRRASVGSSGFLGRADLRFGEWHKVALWSESRDADRGEASEFPSSKVPDSQVEDNY